MQSGQSTPNSPSKGSLGDFSHSSLPSCPAILFKASDRGFPHTYRPGGGGGNGHNSRDKESSFWSVAASQLLSITQQLDAMKTETNALKRSRDEIIDEYEAKLNKVQTQNEEHLFRLKEQLKAKQKRNLSLTQQLETMRSEKTSLRKSHSESLENQQQIIKDYESKLEGLEQYKSRCAEQESALQLKQRQIDEYESQRENMENLKRELLSKEQEVRRLETVTAEELEALRVEANSLRQSQLASLEKQTQLIQEYETKLKETQSQNERVKNLKKEIKEKEKEIESLYGASNDERISRLQSALKMSHTDHEAAKLEYQRELRMLREKDPEFIGSVYRERDELQHELVALRKQFKEREHSLDDIYFSLNLYIFHFAIFYFFAIK